MSPIRLRFLLHTETCRNPRCLTFLLPKCHPLRRHTCVEIGKFIKCTCIFTLGHVLFNSIPIVTTDCFGVAIPRYFRLRHADGVATYFYRRPVLAEGFHPQVADERRRFYMKNAQRFIRLTSLDQVLYERTKGNKMKGQNQTQ